MDRSSLGGGEGHFGALLGALGDLCMGGIEVVGGAAGLLSVATAVLVLAQNVFKDAGWLHVLRVHVVFFIKNTAGSIVKFSVAPCEGTLGNPCT